MLRTPPLRSRISSLLRQEWIIAPLGAWDCLFHWFMHYGSMRWTWPSSHVFRCEVLPLHHEYTKTHDICRFHLYFANLGQYIVERRCYDEHGHIFKPRTTSAPWINWDHYFVLKIVIFQDNVVHLPRTTWCTYSLWYGQIAEMPVRRGPHNPRLVYQEIWRKI